MTRYAIGDIHGGAKTFKALLDRIGLTREDRVYLLGDYIDRGPDCKGVLDIIIRLQNTGYDIRPIRGNHEDMLIRNIIDEHDEWSRYYQVGWGAETLKSFGVTTPSDLDETYQRFLFSLPYCLTDGDFIFVHAGLDMSKDDPLTQTKPEQMMWGNGGFISDNEIDGKIIVSGHKIRSVDKIMESLTKPHIQIDNGAFSNEQPELGNLAALNLDSMSLILQPWIDEEAKLGKDVLMTSFQTNQEEVPLIKEETVSYLIDDEKRAVRIARVMMDDIGQYYPQLVEKGIVEDNIFDLLECHIDEARLEFEKRVSPNLDRTRIFNSALVNVLIKRAYKYKAMG